MKTCSSMLIGGIALVALMQSAHADDAAVLDPKVPCARPEYPRASLVNEEAGTVTIALLIAPDGSVADSKIDKSSGFKNLDKAAHKALSTCKFKPILKNGKPEQAWGKMDYVWKLE